MFKFSSRDKDIFALSNKLNLGQEAIGNLKLGEKRKVYEGVHIERGRLNNAKDIVVSVSIKGGKSFKPKNEDFIRLICKAKEHLDPNSFDLIVEAIYEIALGVEPGTPHGKKPETGLKRNLSYLSNDVSARVVENMMIPQALHSLKWVFASEDLKYPPPCKGRGLLLERICEAAAGLAYDCFQGRQGRLSGTPERLPGVDYSPVDAVLAARMQARNAA